MALRVKIESASEWDIRTVRSATTGSRGRRSAGAAGADFPAEFLAPGRTEVDQVLEVTPRAGVRRAATSPTLDLTIDAAADERALVAVRHPSGALTFHVPDVAMQRRGARGTGPAQLRFRIPVRAETAGSGRRGLVSKAIKVIVLKVAAVLADAMLPRLSRLAEGAWWKQRRIGEGWHAVDAASLAAGKLTAAVPTSGERSLLLIHGTFSDGAKAFGGLAKSTFFQRIAPLYGGRIFAFNHFTISKTPAENADALLRGLPDRKHQFDVITHSRGGLVLRGLVEADHGKLSKRFELGHAVLVAAPNEGTPLVSPQRWEETIGWLANLLELFPENPWTTAVSLVAESLVWLANRVSGGIPGLGAMDAASEDLAKLQGPPGPPRGRYSALVANYRPDDSLWKIALDVGVDAFFATANDLVVPTEGGWRTGLDAGDYVPVERVGSFGLGGNLLPFEPQAVTHMNFFTRPETVDFLVEALLDQPHELPAVETGRQLPTRRSGRAIAPQVASPRTPVSGIAATAAGIVAVFDGAPDKLHLIVLPETDRSNNAQILATYGTARVLVPFRTRGKENAAGRRWQSIIRAQESILNYVDGKPNSQMPTDRKLIELGELLFETLFPGDVRRLYDAARELRRGRRLDVIFTSMIPWVANKPWEFAYDPSRKTFLATEEIHFVRNVLTAVPAERPPPHDGRLKILVAVAQPVGLGQLSVDEEQLVIRRGFEPLIASGAAQVEVLPRATPASLHAAVVMRSPDVVHFIGHGEFGKRPGRDDEEKGYLLFEDGNGQVQWVDDRTLRELLCQRGVRLVFLNACETGQGGRADFNSGVAPALMAGGMSVVVANQYKVLDPSATAFAQHFYWSLARGLSVGEAARESRIAVNYSIDGESIDWAVPVVYARDPEAALCRKGLEVEIGPASAAARASRRRGAKSALRIGVWDVRHAFPQLELTLQEMNRAQSTYSFEVIDLTAPIGTWRLQQADGTRVAHLRADRIAQRLAPRVQQLGLDAMACLTTYPLADEEDDDLYAWSPGDGQPPIMLFSTAGFDVPDDGPLLDRMIVNLLVGGLAGLRGDMYSHKRGPKNCPLYYNPNREFKWLVAPAEFDHVCRAGLRKSPAKAELPALEALLKAFAAPVKADKPAK